MKSRDEHTARDLSLKRQSVYQLLLKRQTYSVLHFLSGLFLHQVRSRLTFYNAFFIQAALLMFLGPGAGSAGISEVFLLPTPSSGLASATCTVPTYPLTDIRASVGFVHDEYIQICGIFSLYSLYLLLQYCSWIQ